MKIVYCLPSLYIPGGMERVLSIKANYLADVLGYDVTIVLTDEKEKRPYYELSDRIKLVHLDLNYNRLWNRSLPVRVVGYAWKQLFYRKRLRACLYEIRPDITVSMLRREINFINSIHDGSVKVGEIHVNRDNFRDFKEEKTSNVVKNVVARLWMRQLVGKLRQLACFVVLTEEDKGKWKELENVRVIPNPLSFFPDRVSDCTSHEVVAVGRYVYQKGFDLLLRAWVLVAAKHPDWKLRIYGGGEREEFVRQAKGLGVAGSCFLEGAVGDVTDKYCAASVFVLSSRYEGFGLVISEAMACGVPAVSFACPCGPRDIITEGEDGFLVENGDVGVLAEKIIYLIEHEDVRKQMGVYARRNAERFRIERIGEQWRELFEGIAPGGRD